MDNNLQDQVMLERVELIARLTADGACNERDREVALALIADITRSELMRNSTQPLFFSNLFSKNNNLR